VAGPGAEQLAGERSTAAGTPGFRIFNIQTAGVVGLSGLTIRNGQADFWGGNPNEAATLTVRDCAIVGNSATQQGGGINNLSSLNLSNCVVNNNKVTSAGGSGGDAFGGGINNAGTLTALNCVISTNAASVLVDASAFGGGIYSDGTL